MFQKLVNHNEDIKRLVKKGYAVAFDSNYMVIQDIPYLDAQKKLQEGAIVTKLEFIDQEHVKQHNHQIHFAGSTPHGLDGEPIPNLGDRQANLSLSEEFQEINIQRSFSNKPKKTGKFENFFDKIESYVGIISGPAMAVYDTNPYTFRCVKEVVSNSVFNFHDTLSSRAEINDLSEKLKNDVVAVIGLGGTGAYILDLLVKTPVQEIRAFDLDPFHVHNAFRSPGKLNKNELGKTKAEVYESRYNNFRSGLSTEPKFIDNASEEDLNGVTFAFVCVDKGSSRSSIFDLLISMDISFIDVGMGLNRKHGPIGGMIRTTYYPASQGSEVRNKNLAPTTDNSDDEYDSNIQIAELNALNACLAVIKFKQLRDFYQEDVSDFHLLFGLNDLKIAGESKI